jgi:hypothetical protein
MNLEHIPRAMVNTTRIILYTCSKKDLLLDDSASERPKQRYVTEYIPL